MTENASTSARPGAFGAVDGAVSNEAPLAPASPPAPAAVSDAAEAQCVPRVLEFAVVKRIDPRLPNTWGHWWIELGEESYGWWPMPCPMGWRGAMLGSRGCLNGTGGAAGATMTRDAYHGDEPDHWFHPTLVVAKSDDQVRAEIRAFAQSYVGGFRWQWWWLKEPGENCRTFQQEMFEAVGLFEEPEYLYTQGSGCPFMFPFRKARWRTQDLLAAVLARVLAARRVRWGRHRERTDPLDRPCRSAAGTTTAKQRAGEHARARSFRRQARRGHRPSDA